MSKIEGYAKEIPEEIRRAIRGLDSDYRAAIFVALYKHGELSFAELQKMLGMDKAMLNYHLGKLVEGALIQHYYRHELGVDKYSFYSVTHFGQNFLEALTEFLRPGPRMRADILAKGDANEVFVAIAELDPQTLQKELALAPTI